MNAQNFPADINTETMYLVYVDSEGEYHYQNWQDLTWSGTLIDGDTGEDMDLVGWSATEG